jgi:hypothetical protein
MEFWPPTRTRQLYNRYVVGFSTEPRDICVVGTNNSAETAMPEGQERVEWDFLTLITAWNLYALPALLLVTGIFIFVKNRRRQSTNPAAIGLDGPRVVCMIALIHLGLGLHGAIRLAQELLTMRVMGVTESFANFIVEMVTAIVNPLIAAGLWRPRPAARYWAIVWYVFLSAIAVLVVHWYWRYQVPVEARLWPNHLVARVMPLFLLVVMFLPRVKQVFARQKTATVDSEELDANEPAPELGARWSVVSLAVLLFLIVVGSNLTVDTADWIERSVAEWNQTAES